MLHLMQGNKGEKSVTEWSGVAPGAVSGELHFPDGHISVSLRCHLYLPTGGSGRRVPHHHTAPPLTVSAHSQQDGATERQPGGAHTDKSLWHWWVTLTQIYIHMYIVHTHLSSCRAEWWALKRARQRAVENCHTLTTACVPPCPDASRSEVLRARDDT